jgi:hypothetical protein
MEASCRGQAERCAAAAAVLLTQVLRRSPSAGEPSGCKTHTRLIATLRSSLTLTHLLGGLRSSELGGVRCAAVMHLTATLVWAAALTPTLPVDLAVGVPPTRPAFGTASVSQSDQVHAEVEDSRADGAEQDAAPRARWERAVAENDEAWGTALPLLLLNTSLRTEPPVLAALGALTSALATRAPSLVDRLAAHPWQSFALETVASHRREMRAPACEYWCSVLGRRAAWTHAFVSLRPASVRELLVHALHAAPFTRSHVALLRTLHGIAALGPRLVSDASQLLRLRCDQPTASRWAGPAAEEEEEEAPHVLMDGGGGEAFAARYGVIFPIALLEAEPPAEHRPGGGGGGGGASGVGTDARVKGHAGRSWGGSEEVALLREAEQALAGH